MWALESDAEITDVWLENKTSIFRRLTVTPLERNKIEKIHMYRFYILYYLGNSIKFVMTFLNVNIIWQLTFHCQNSCTCLSMTCHSYFHHISEYSLFQSNQVGKLEVLWKKHNKRERIYFIGLNKTFDENLNEKIK